MTNYNCLTEAIQKCALSLTVSGIIADNILFLSRKCQADSGHTQDLI